MQFLTYSTSGFPIDKKKNAQPDQDKGSKKDEETEENIDLPRS